MSLDHPRVLIQLTLPFSPQDTVRLQLYPRYSHPVLSRLNPDGPVLAPPSPS